MTQSSQPEAQGERHNVELPWRGRFLRDMPITVPPPAPPLAPYVPVKERQFAADRLGARFRCHACAKPVGPHAYEGLCKEHAERVIPF